MELPSRACLMPNMIESKIVKHHSVPVIILQLVRNMSSDIIINFSKILDIYSARLSTTMASRLTETKKLEVPSERSKKLGNNFNQVSSPYMIIFPESFAFNCASHVSCVARLDEVSDSAKFRITSKKDGMEPVVMALILGMVMVGDVA